MPIGYNGQTGPLRSKSKVWIQGHHHRCAMTDTTVIPRPGKKSPKLINGKSDRLKAVAADNFAAARSGADLWASMLAFRDGDFSARLPTNWSGTDGRIAEAFNQALRHEDRIAREVTRLSTTVGEAGRLKQRMSLPGAIGGWATKVNSLNTLLDDFRCGPQRKSREPSARWQRATSCNRWSWRSTGDRSRVSSCVPRSWSTR